VERIKNIFSGGNKRFFYIGGGIVLLVLLGYIIRRDLAPSTPAPPTETPVTTTLPSATSTEILSTPRSTSTELPTEIPFTPAPISTDLPTEIPPTPIPKFGIGDTMISEKDGMVMVYVPAGEFHMGNENVSNYYYDDARPVHTVYLDAFWIDQTEVTNAMYARCVEAGECDPPSSTRSVTHDIYYGNSKFDNYPVINVFWNDAATFCKWAGRRLPSEAEWEKAAGWDEDAQAHRLYPWGDKIDHSYANYGQYAGDAVAVGSYEKGVSFYGAYDMAGNVSEWVQDWYDVYPGGDKSASEDFGQSYRVIRGGDFHFGGVVDSIYRWRADPSMTNFLFGFRCARDAK
jgi:formylglycine-generating enzyme required for sulfatase activity